MALQPAAIPTTKLAAKAPIKMLRQSTCLYVSAAEVLDQLSRQVKSRQRQTTAKNVEGNGERHYIVIDFRATEDLESQVKYN